MSIQVAGEHDLQRQSIRASSPAYADASLDIHEAAISIHDSPGFVKLVMKRNNVAQLAESVVLLGCDGPTLRDVVGNATGRVELHALYASGVVGVQDGVVDEVPAAQVNADNRPKF